MSPSPERGRRLALAAGGGALFLAAALWLGARGEERDESPSVILSDSTARPDAVGMCAMDRETGAVEGRIAAIAPAPVTGELRYRIERLDNPGVSNLVAPAAVQIVACGPARRVSLGP